MARVRFRALRLCVCYLWVYVGVMGMQASPRPDSTTPSSLPRAIDGVSRGLFHSRLSQVDLSQVQSSQVESSRVKSSQVESSRVKSSQVEGPLDASPRACLQDRSESTAGHSRGKCRSRPSPERARWASCRPSSVITRCFNSHRHLDWARGCYRRGGAAAATFQAAGASHPTLEQTRGAPSSVGPHWEIVWSALKNRRCPAMCSRVAVLHRAGAACGSYRDPSAGG